MKLLIEGEHEVSGRRVKMIIPCYQSVYPLSWHPEEKCQSVTLYLKLGEEIEVYDNGTKAENVDVIALSKHAENNYYHKCIWSSRTSGGFVDVTMDIYLRNVSMVVFADDYDEKLIEQ